MLYAGYVYMAIPYPLVWPSGVSAERQEKLNESPARGQVRNTRGMKMVSGGIDSRNTGKAEKQ